jgi:hypothetical protein
MELEKGTLELICQLARVGKVELYCQSQTLACAKWSGKWQGQRIDLQAVESTMDKAIIELGNQAAARLDLPLAGKECFPGAEGRKSTPGGKEAGRARG